MALTNLTFGDGTNKALLCSMKPSMEALVAQLFSSNEELCQVAASVLRNLSWKADLASKKTLREVGAVTSLMRASMKVQKETTLKSILSALWNLSAHCSENKADICAVENALEFLISSLTYKSPSKTFAIIENGGGILRNVSSHIAVREDYRTVLRQHGCLQILLKHLRSTSLTIVSNACGTLWNLSARCAEDQQALWEMGAVGMLRNLVHSKHKMISMGSSAALKNLLAARPAMKNIDLKKNANQNRPTLQIRKQRALESEIDQNLAETCENMESPRDSPIDKKQDSEHFVYPVYQLQDGDPRRPMLRAPVMPRSQSGDNALYTDKGNQPGVARSGSQDSVGSTHSDISHDRNRHSSGPRTSSLMGGSLDRNKEGNILGQRQPNDGRTERNPLGTPNSRILQVMQEVALHAGINSQKDTNPGVFKVPYPITSLRQAQSHNIPPSSSSSAPSSQHMSSQQQHPAFMAHMLSQAHSMPYQGYLMSTLPPHSGANNFPMANHQRSLQPDDDESDEKPLDYSMKYQENGPGSSNMPQSQQQQHLGPRFPLHQPRPMVGNYVGGLAQHGRGRFPGPQMRPYLNHRSMGQQMNARFQYNPAYAETDLDDPEQPTDYSARYGVEFNQDERVNYGARYSETDPNCADCKLEEARRYNDRLEQAIDEDQIKTFCTEDTPYLSTATSLTDLSTAMKIMEEAEQACPRDDRDFSGDETKNFSSTYGENERSERQQSSESQRSDDSHKGVRFDEKSSRSGSNVTDIQTGTTVITNYNLKIKSQDHDSSSLQGEEVQERSFHDNRNDDGPSDQTKTYCEEGTPVCFSRVSSLSSLHSSEAADRQEKRPNGPLQPIHETEDMKNSAVKRPPPALSPQTYRHKDGMNENSSEKEHKTVTFDDKEQVQETPMMFSRSTSLGSLSSFDTQSVHSSVFSEYSRRASEVVSPSELPDSPSETMPPSPKRTKSPERTPGVRNVKQELFPPFSGPQQFISQPSIAAQQISPLRQLIHMNDIMMKQMDYETGSCKSEAPVVYADEGTPPIFHDNLSELSCITSDNYNINDKTLVGSQGHMTPGSKSQGSSSNRTADITITSNKPSGLADKKDEASNHGQEESSDKPENVLEKTNQAPEVSKLEHAAKQSSESTQGEQKEGPKQEDKAMSSNSDVSEGEDEILANFINSAMPISTKKSRKSSENNSRRKSSSSKPDSGSSSRSKTPAKSQPQSGNSSKSSSVNSSAKKTLIKQPSNKSSKENSPEDKQRSDKPQGSSPGKKSQIPRPLQHRQLQQLNQLDTSQDSTRTFTDDDSPFNTSNTQSVIAQSVIARSAQKPRPAVKPSPLILQKAQNLSNLDYDDGYDMEEGCKTYATEDTPFSGSIPASPKSTRKFGDDGLYDHNQDTVRSFATEDTPFSGSMPGSPGPERRAQTVGDIETDSVKCYNTEDTPFSGSAFGSPKAQRKQINGPPPSSMPNQGPVPSRPAVPVPKPQTSSQIKETGGLPARHPNFNPQLLANVGYGDYDDGCDAIKTYATEGTPQNYSRTGSCSDLSSLNANFDEKVKIVIPIQERNSSKAQEVAKPVVTNQQNFRSIEDDKSDSSSLDDNEDLLSEIIQSAMPPPKPNSKSRRSMDRHAEGAESVAKDNFRFNRPSHKPSQIARPSYPSHFQPSRTSSIAQDANKGRSQVQRFGSEANDDQMRTYAVEGTPNMSNSTSLSDLTTDSSSHVKKTHNTTKPSNSSMSSQNNSNMMMNYGQSVTYSAGNDSVFMQADGIGDSMRVFKMEGTPQSFSCNESLSSLGIVDDDSNNAVAQQVKALANRLTGNMSTINANTTAEVSVTKPTSNKSQSQSKASSVSEGSQEFHGDLERQVIGQSSEDQSVHEEEHRAPDQEEIRNYKVEDTPLCFSVNSSLSDIHDEVEKSDASKPHQKQPQPESHKQASKDEYKLDNKVEHTPICFSRNSSLSSLSVNSDDDEDPDELALLENCISSALPPRTRPPSRPSSTTGKPRSNQPLSGDEGGSHDSRISSWRQQPHRSNEELFRMPAADARGRPCRSRSQDCEKRLKDMSNQQLAQQCNNNNIYRGSFDSLANQRQDMPVNNNNHQQQQQILSETKNFTQQMIQMTRSVEKGDNQSEKADSPASDYNFFMMCSGNTEISVEGISKQSFPSSMAPDTDDDLLDGSLISSFRNDADGQHGNHDDTLREERSGVKSMNSTLTEGFLKTPNKNGQYMGNSITSEDGRALAENANIVMSEMHHMVISGASTVDEDRFIENETLSLVSDYLSDTASESNTWSGTSDLPSEANSTRSQGGASQSSGRPRIVKPGSKAIAEKPAADNEEKSVRGRRKPLYPGKPAASPQPSKQEKPKPTKLSPRYVK